MEKLIKASVLKKTLAHMFPAMIRNAELSKRDMALEVLNRIDTTPTIDAKPADVVEVVRCKDCVYACAFTSEYAKNRFENGMNCTLCRGDCAHGIYGVSVIYQDDYCSDGVKRERPEP